VVVVVVVVVLRLVARFAVEHVVLVYSWKAQVGVCIGCQKSLGEGYTIPGRLIDRSIDGCVCVYGWFLVDGWCTRWAREWMESCFHSNSLYWLGEHVVVIYLRLLRVWSIGREESFRPGNSRLITLEISVAVVEHCVTSFKERFIHSLILLLSTW